MNQFDRQAQASLDRLDAEELEAAQERVNGILHKGPQAVKQTSFNPDAFQADDFDDGKGSEFHHHTPPAKPQRKERSDKGTHKTPADEITLKLHFDVARDLAKTVATTMPSLSALIQDQIIQNLLRRVQK